MCENYLSVEKIKAHYYLGTTNVNAPKKFFYATSLGPLNNTAAQTDHRLTVLAVVYGENGF